MNTSNTKSRTSGLSPEDVAALATARPSGAAPSTPLTSSLGSAPPEPILSLDASSSSSRATAQHETEQSYSPSALAARTAIYEYSSQQTTGAQRDIDNGIRYGQLSTASSVPSGKPCQKPGPRGLHLPSDAKTRKRIPLYSGLVKYFPDALVAVAALSFVGNEQHSPGKPLHWDRSKSTDQEDTLLRHLFEAGTVDVDGVRHSAKVAWRALAMLQLELEREKSGAN